MHRHTHTHTELRDSLTQKLHFKTHLVGSMVVSAVYPELKAQRVVHHHLDFAAEHILGRVRRDGGRRGGGRNANHSEIAILSHLYTHTPHAVTSKLTS